MKKKSAGMVEMPKDMQDEMDNTVHVDVDIRKLPKEKAAKMREFLKKEQEEHKKEMKMEQEKYRDRHERRTKTILGLLLDEKAPTEKEAPKMEHKEDAMSEKESS